MWKWVESDAEVLCPSHLGYAAPFPAGTPFSVQDEVAHVLEQLPSGRDLHLIAHSYGGFVALELARVRAVRSAFIYEPVVFGALLGRDDLDEGTREQLQSFASIPWFLEDDERAGTDEWLQVFIDYWNGENAWSKMPETMRESMRPLGWKMAMEVRAVYDRSMTFERFALPDTALTLVAGERTHPPAKAMVKHLGRVNPHASVVVAEGAGHMAPLIRPRRVKPLLDSHLERVRA